MDVSKIQGPGEPADTQPAKHTPRPWSLRGEFMTRYIYARGENVSGVVATVNLAWPGKEQQEEQLANARLIAAAPELLALAIEMEAFSEAAMQDAIEADEANGGQPSEHKLDVITWTDRMNHCRAVIAKATGAAA